MSARTGPPIRSRRARRAGALASACALVLPAWAAGAHHRRPGPLRLPAPASAPALPGQAPAAIKLTLKQAGGDPPFLLRRQSVAITGVLSPFVAGQQVIVRLSRRGHTVAELPATVVPGPGGQGSFQAAYGSPRAGQLTVTAVHAATPQQAAAVSPALPVRWVNRHAHRGARGPTVRLLQSELSHLHYAVALSGVFDAATARALVAYRKVVGLARTPRVDSGLLLRLQRGRGAFHVRYPHQGKHVEADLSHQVLAEISAGGHVRRIYTMSSGKPSTPTVVGRFHVYSKTRGTNQKGMVDSNYFIGGYAIHGYHQVPVHAASHGCLRVPIPDAAAIFSWLQIGNPVDVYSHHGGSQRVRHHGVGP